MTINEKIEKLSKLYDDLYKEKNKKIKFPGKIKEINEKIKEIKQQLINPDEGTYFGIYKKLKAEKNENWIFDGRLFINISDADDAVKSLRDKIDTKNEIAFNDYEVRRIVIQETDIEG